MNSFNEYAKRRDSYECVKKNVIGRRIELNCHLSFWLSLVSSINKYIIEVFLVFVARILLQTTEKPLYTNFEKNSLQYLSYFERLMDNKCNNLQLHPLRLEQQQQQQQQQHYLQLHSRRELQHFEQQIQD